MAAEAAGKTIYCVRHGESTFNEWRKKSLKDFSWMWVRDPMILDAPLSAKGRMQVGGPSIHNAPHRCRYYRSPCRSLSLA